MRDVSALAVYTNPPWPTAKDRALAALWGVSGSGKHRETSMLSARRAELVAIEIYRKLHTSVTDISGLQSTSDVRWKLADVKVGGSLIDVKNSVRSYNGEWQSISPYTDHTVKRFKTDEEMRHVVISGFVSEYSDFVHQEHRESSPTREPLVVWLGHTKKESLDDLSREFRSDLLEVAFESREREGYAIPPWAFEFPPALYAEQHGVLETLRLSMKSAAARPSSALAFLTIPISTNQANLKTNEEWERLKSRFPDFRPSRPRIFLHVLERCLSLMRTGQHFQADQMRDMILLFYGTDSEWNGVKTIPGNQLDRMFPLGTFDPLETVASLIDAMEVVSLHCAKEALRFKRFRLGSKGVLDGFDASQQRSRILAYCGGWRRNPRIRCGANPLHIGRNQVCRCGHLICHKCYSCSEIWDGEAAHQCPEAIRRQEGLAGGADR
jgi:hypothetical protein